MTKDEYVGRPMTATTDDGEKISYTHFAYKSCFLERLLVFEKRRKFNFFHRSVPVTKEENDGRRQRPTTAKKSNSLILPKNLEFRKDCLFLKNCENLIFYTGPSL